MSWAIAPPGTITFTGGSIETLEQSVVASGLSGNNILHVIIEGYGSIGDYAFQDATSLVSVTIPANVISIGNYAFQGATSLDMVLFEVDSLLVSIGDYAFAEARMLRFITIPSLVISIGNNTFQNAASLVSISFGAVSYADSIRVSKLATIGDYVFQGATSLVSITIPSSVTAIGLSAFVNATGLTSVTFAAGSNLLTIGNYAFQGARFLVSITIPADVTAIGTNAFLNSGLETVYIYETTAAVLSQEYGTNMLFYGATDVAVVMQQTGLPPPLPLILDLPSLDSSANNNTLATFVGDYTYDNGMGDAQLYTSISVSDMQGIFKFSSNSVLNDIDNATDDLAAVYAYPKLFKDGTAYALSTSIATADANPSNSSNLLDHATAVGKPYGVATHKFLKKVAVCVFGSELALDMFLNETDIANGYISAINSCITSVNNKFAPDSGDDAKAAAAKRIYDAMISKQSSRFGLKYNAEPGTVPPSQGPHACTTSTSTAAAAVSVVIAANGSVLNMTLTTPGSGFILGQSVAFSSGDVVVASIASINSVQVAMLNGTLDQPTSMPFEANDMFTVMFTVSTNSGQLNVSGDIVSTSTVTRVNIKVVQGP